MTVAVRLLDSPDRRLAELRASIDEGFAAIEHGEGVELTSELMDEIEREAGEACRRGDSPHHDSGSISLPHYCSIVGIAWRRSDNGSLGTDSL